MEYFKVLKEDLWRAIIFPTIRNSFFAYYFAPFFNLLESMQPPPRATYPHLSLRILFKAFEIKYCVWSFCGISSEYL